MSFLNNLVNEFTQSDRPSQSSEYPQSQFPRRRFSSNPPQVPPPWIAEWDAREESWVYYNQETGQRTFQPPQQQYHGGAGASGQQYGSSYGGSQTRSGSGSYEEERRPDHSRRNMALAGVAGLEGGALLMHEGEEIKEHWDRDEERLDYDKDRFDQRFDYDKDRVEQGFEDAPGDIAGWAGRKTQEVEDIPEDIERKWDNGVQDVEDIPEDIAGWAGRQEGRVERFDDNIEGSYDQGRDEERYEDERRDDY